jgi:hypothetical protein
MRTFLKILAWIGFLIVAFGVIALWVGWFTPNVTPEGYAFEDFSPLAALALSIIGTPLMILGGLVAKPRFLWISCITLSVVYTIPFIPTIPETIHEIQHTDKAFLFSNGWVYSLIWNRGLFFIPGIVILILGICLKVLEARCLKTGH